MSNFSPVDGVILAVLLVALVRGMFIGLIREGFSIAAVAAACFAVRFATEPVAQYVYDFVGESIGTTGSSWLAGVAVAVVTLGVVGMAGRWLRRGARAVGLGMFDRVGGAALGTAEGLLVVVLLLLGANWVLGPDHPSLERSAGAQIFENVQSYVMEGEERAPDVAAPPP